MGGIGFLLADPRDVFFRQLSAGYLAEAYQRVVEACRAVGWPAEAIEAGELNECLCTLADEVDPGHPEAVSGDFRDVPLSGFGFVLVGDAVLEQLWPRPATITAAGCALYEELIAGSPKLTLAMTQSDIFAWMEFHGPTDASRIDPADAHKVLDWFAWAASSSDGDTSSWWVHIDPRQGHCPEPGAEDQPWWRALAAAAHNRPVELAGALEDGRRCYSPIGHQLLADAANHILGLAQGDS
jgi:hypothetical protein